MNKHEAYHSFMSSFGLSAYDETSVPDSAQLPYITYEMPDDFFGQDCAVTASVWTRSSSWLTISTVSDQIAMAIGRGGKMVPYTGGAFWIRRGVPWAQRMGDVEDDKVRRIVLNMIVEFED